MGRSLIPICLLHAPLLRTLIVVGGLALTGHATGQANWTEGFDSPTPTTFPNRGPDGLVAAGWDFRVQTTFAGNVRVWEHNSLAQFGPATFPPVGGGDYLKLFGTHDRHSAYWALLPAIPNQVGGDHVGVWLNGIGATSESLFELRYSPTGGTSTGTTWSDFGDFTEVLASLQDIPSGWQLVDGVTPGSGRVALRVYDDINVNGSLEVALDEATVGPMQSCPSCLPLPAPGQTVHWPIGLSPVTIDQSQTIVAGGTVVVDPGVVVELSGVQTRLDVHGRMEFGPGTSLRQLTSSALLSVVGGAAEVRFDGTATSPASLSGDPSFGVGVELSGGGTLRLIHADVNMGIHGETTPFQLLAPTVIARDATFLGAAVLKDLHLETGTLVATDSTFQGPALRTEDVFLALNGVTFDGSQLQTDRRHAGQPLLLDQLVGINVLDGAPFVLRGSQHHFGSNNLIQGNRWPVELTGGLTPDSQLPATGNQEDVIRLNGLGIGPTTLPELGLIYEADSDVAGTHCDVHPGTTFRMGPGTFFGPSGGGGGLYEVNLRGTAQAPIRFEAQGAGTPWGGLSWNQDGERAVAEWVEVRGAAVGVQARDGSRPWLLNCLFEGCEIGGRGSQQGRPIFRKTRFLANDIGVTTSTGVPGIGVFAGNFDVESATNPCAFEGNTVGAWDQNSVTLSPAAHAWWGSPSGPQATSNPAGTGDSIVGAVSFSPFATTAPDFTSTPPSVRIADMSSFAYGGTAVILQWEVEDDGEVLEYRLEHTHHHFCEPYTVFEAGIPGDTTSWVIQLPLDTTSSSCVGNAAFRLVATDDTGQEGYDVWDYQVLLDAGPEPLPTIAPLSSMARPGDNLLFGTTNTSPTATTRVHVDCERAAYGQGSLQQLQLAPVSTDLARLSISTPSMQQLGNLEGFSEYFEIRPDPNVIGDVPPAVDLLSPLAGDTYRMGDIVPVRWMASDDGALHSFEIQASYDSGIAWHVLVEGLEGTAATYDWQLPRQGPAIQDVRLRVIARDSRFQVSSDGSDRSFSLVEGGRVGSNYCVAVPNSSGSAAAIQAFGSPVAANNDLLLVATGLPASQFGMFLTSPTQGFVSGPGGSQGNLCLGGAIGRFNQPGEVMPSGIGGRIELLIDLTALPTPTGPAPVLAGQTHRFQAWFRDGQSSNFTDAIAVTFL